MHGWIFLDKPHGMSSNFALSRVKRLLGQKKAGFSGTLDPLATGVLPIALGEALKTMHYMTFSTKFYRFEVTFGQKRTTGDEEGEVMESSPVRPTATEILHILPEFLGEIAQIPPLYSALKIDGKRACDRVRDGEEVVMKERNVTLYALSYEGGVFEKKTRDDDKNTDEHFLERATFTVECSAGTYVRSLAQDLAKAVGTFGYVSMLRRTKVGAFDEGMTIALEKLESLVHSKSNILSLHPVGIGLDDILAIHITGSDYEDLLMGKYMPCTLPNTQEHQVVRFLDQGRFRGLGTFEQGLLKPKRMININR